MTDADLNRGSNKECTCDNGDTKVGAVLPQKPEKPLDSDCCGSGCVPCVLDIYEQDIKIWEEECRQLSKCRACTRITEQQRAPDLSVSEYRTFQIISVTDITEDTKVFRFLLSHDKSLGLKIGQHVIVRVKDNGSSISRQYTPISSISSKGYFDLMIKIYRNGRMSEHVKEWRPGDEIDVRGPFGELSYIPNKYKKIFMLAAGTGIAPMAQVIQAILDDEEDETFIHLLYSSVSYKNILLKQHLNEWTAYWNFSVLYCLSRENGSHPTSQYRYGDRIHYGKIDESLLRKEIGSLSENILVLVCGTRSFDEDMKHYLTENGLQSERLHKF